MVKWENNQGALVGHKPACIGLLQDFLGPLGERRKVGFPKGLEIPCGCAGHHVMNGQDTT